MSGLSFVPLGVGDAFSALWYSSCLLVEAEGERLLVDCPHPIRKILREATGGHVDVADVRAVVLTHLHADHASGLEGFGYYARFVLGRRAQLALHPSVLGRLWEGHLAAGMEALLGPEAETAHAMTLCDYFEISELDLERPLELGPFVVECRATRHHIPTTALRITAGGRTLGVSADTAFDPGLIAWLGRADLVIHETNHGAHTPYAALAGLPAELRAKMRLIHYPDDFDRGASVIAALEQGVRVVV